MPSLNIRINVFSNQCLIYAINAMFQQNSEYLLSRCDSGMSYVNHDAWTIDEKRSNKNLKIKGCIKDVITITCF